MVGSTQTPSVQGHAYQNKSCSKGDQNISCSRGDQNKSCSRGDQNKSCSKGGTKIDRAQRGTKISVVPRPRRVASAGWARDLTKIFKTKFDPRTQGGQLASFPGSLFWILCRSFGESCETKSGNVVNIYDCGCPLASFPGSLFRILSCCETKSGTESLGTKLDVYSQIRGKKR